MASKGIERIRVAILQLRVWPFSRQAENREYILNFIEQAIKLKPHLIVLPECVYPCYFLSPRIIKDYDQLGYLCDHFFKEIKEYAKKYKTFLALSLPEYSRENRVLYNSAFLIDDQGQQVGHSRKSFLWHFDNLWFRAGSDFPVFDTRIGKIGMLICADGRQPEIARCLSLQGADILLDMTNLVTSGLEKKAWTNPQVDYILPTRAMENNIWIVLANKVGIEENSIQCCGKSSVFSPGGEVVSMASSDRDEILLAEIDLSISRGNTINKQVFQFQNRRPELYSYLTKPTEELSLYKSQHRDIDKPMQNPFASVIQIKSLPKEHSPGLLDQIENFFHSSRDQDVNILSFSQIDLESLSIQKSRLILDLLKKLTINNDTICSIVLKEIDGPSLFKTMFLIQSGKIIAKYRKTHLLPNEENEFISRGDDFPIIKTQFGNIGMMIDYEGFFPEIARILTLKGADIIIWSSRFTKDEHLKICQTRSAENKIFIICSNSIDGKFNGHSIISSPSGQIIAGCLEGEIIASSALIDTCLSKNKIIVPFTDVIMGRQPDAYRILTSEKNTPVDSFGI